MAQRYRTKRPTKLSSVASSRNPATSCLRCFARLLPAYSNGLKDVVRFLGYVWADPTMSGALASIRRLRWEQTKEHRSSRGSLSTTPMTAEHWSRSPSRFPPSWRARRNQVWFPYRPPSQRRHSIVKGSPSPSCGDQRSSLLDHQRDLVYVRSSRRQRRPRRKARRKEAGSSQTGRSWDSHHHPAQFADARDSSGYFPCACAL